jgi:hypothetical protein
MTGPEEAVLAAWPVPGEDTVLTTEEAAKVWRIYLTHCSQYNKKTSVSSEAF